MQDKRILQILADDLSTGGHVLGDEIRSLSNEHLLDLDAIIYHWRFQVTREVKQRSLTSRFEEAMTTD